MSRLEIDSIVLELGARRILSDIYMRGETGQVTALVGSNGSGKSCLLNIIMGRLTPLSKSVRIDGRPLKRAYPEINYLPQVPFVPGSLTLRRAFSDYEVGMQTFISDFPTFKNRLSHKFRHLSGGDRRLIEVYLLIKTPARFTLLDEPFTHIMPLQLEKIKQIIREEKNKGFLITDHLYKEAMEIAQNSYLLRQGKTCPVNDMEALQSLGYINGPHL